MKKVFSNQFSVVSKNCLTAFRPTTIDLIVRYQADQRTVKHSGAWKWSPEASQVKWVIGYCIPNEQHNQGVQNDNTTTLSADGTFIHH